MPTLCHSVIQQMIAQKEQENLPLWRLKQSALENLTYDHDILCSSEGLFSDINGPTWTQSEEWL